MKSVLCVYLVHLLYLLVYVILCHEIIKWTRKKQFMTDPAVFRKYGHTQR